MKRRPIGSCYQRRCLPVKGANRILHRRFGQVSHRRMRETEERRNDFVGSVHLGHGPDQIAIAIEAQQTRTMRAVHSPQPRFAEALPFLPIDEHRIALLPVAR
jgi:hypothetical protein